MLILLYYYVNTVFMMIILEAQSPVDLMNFLFDDFIQYLLSAQCELGRCPHEADTLHAIRH